MANIFVSLLSAFRENLFGCFHLHTFMLILCIYVIMINGKMQNIFNYKLTFKFAKCEWYLSMQLG